MPSYLYLLGILINLNLQIIFFFLIFDLLYFIFITFLFILLFFDFILLNAWLSWYYIYTTSGLCDFSIFRLWNCIIFNDLIGFQIRYWLEISFNFIFFIICHLFSLRQKDIMLKQCFLRLTLTLHKNGDFSLIFIFFIFSSCTSSQFSGCI